MLQLSILNVEELLVALLSFACKHFLFFLKFVDEVYCFARYIIFLCQVCALWREQPYYRRENSLLTCWSGLKGESKTGFTTVMLVCKRFETMGLKTCFSSLGWMPRALSVRGAALVVLLYLSNRQVVGLTLIYSLSQTETSIEVRLFLTTSSFSIDDGVFGTHASLAACFAVII